MVGSTLVDTDIAASYRLLVALDEAEFPVKVSYWQKELEADIWYLYLVSPRVHHGGVRESYERVLELLPRSEPRLSSTQIKLIGSAEYFPPRSAESPLVPFSTGAGEGQFRYVRAPRHPAAPFPGDAFNILREALPVLEHVPPGEVPGDEDHRARARNARDLLARLALLLRNFDSASFPMGSRARVEEALSLTLGDTETAARRARGLMNAWSGFWED